MIKEIVIHENRAQICFYETPELAEIQIEEPQNEKSSHISGLYEPSTMLPRQDSNLRPGD